MMMGRLELRLPSDLLERIEEWRNGQTVPPTKAAAIRYIIEAGLRALDAHAGVATICGQEPANQ